MQTNLVHIMRLGLIVFALLASRLVRCSSNLSQIDPDLLLAKIKSFTVDALQCEAIQEHFDSLEYQRTELNGEHLLNSLVKSLGSKFDDRVTAVRRLRDAVVASYQDGNAPKTQCCLLDAEFDSSQYCLRVAPTSPNQTKHLNDLFLGTCAENLKHLPSIKWQYFGSDQGVTSAFPASAFDDCDSYDNRIRPWYVETNVPAPKQLVLVIDISSSMKTSTVNGVSLMHQAQQAAKVVINTLNSKDKFAVLAFSDQLHTVPYNGYDPCFADNLAITTTQNKNKVFEFVDNLSGGGGTSYGPALEKAFAYFDNEQSTSTEADRVILFISDGDSKERGSEIFNMISERNSKLNNTVVLMTYGLGNNSFDILKEMSALSIQKSSYEEQQAFTHIKDPSNLQNQMAKYYNFFSKAGHATNEPIWTVPYLDAWGLGLIITGSLPVYRGGELIGVVAVDVTVEELLTESLHFKPNQHSYSFVINDAGLVINHPLLPYHIDDKSLFVTATSLERDPEFLSVFESMKSGGTGQKTFTRTRFSANGDNYHGVKEVKVLSTYYWNRVPNSKFSICLVLQNNQTSLLSDQGIVKKDSFLFNRFDVETPPTTCRHLNSLCSKDQSSIFLTEEALSDSFPKDKEADLQVQNMEAFVQGKLLPHHGTSVAHGIKDHIVATQQAESLWMSMDPLLQSEVLWVYLATNDGLLRVYPGTQLPINFDPKLRPWFKHSVARPDKHVVTTPYMDVVTDLPIVTMGTALFKKENAGNFSGTKEVIGVMAVDVSLTHFFDIVKKLYPDCADTHMYGCLIIDTSGYVVMSNDDHTDLIPEKHITQVQPGIASALIRDGVLQSTSCSNMDTGHMLQSYQISDSQKRHAGITSNLPCKKFLLIPVRNTNLFMVVLNKKKVDCISLTTKACVCSPWKAQFKVSCSSSWTGEFCECPCTAPNPFYRTCSNFYARDSPPPCMPTVPNRTFLMTEKPNVGALPSCFQQSFNFTCGKDCEKGEAKFSTVVIIPSVLIPLCLFIACAIVLHVRKQNKLLDNTTEPKVPLSGGATAGTPSREPFILYPVLPPYEASPTRGRSLPFPGEQPNLTVENHFLDRGFLPERSPQLSSRPPPQNPQFESTQLESDV